MQSRPALLLLVLFAPLASSLAVHQEHAWSWPWSRKAPAAKAPEPVAPAAKASAKVPSAPGCWMRMLSGCPKEPMRTLLWRHDPYAEEKRLDEAACLRRKKTWDKHCESEDAEMVFVGEEVDHSLAADPTFVAEAEAEAQAHDELVGDEGPFSAPAAAEAADPAENATEAAPATEAQEVSKPLDKEGSVGLLQVGTARWAWPWSKPKRHIIGQEITTTAEPAMTTKAAAEAQEQAQPVENPLQPGCYMRIPTGCPKKTMRTQLWRHDTWAEEQGLDSLACTQRKGVWDKYCETQDALMFFVSK